MRLIETVALRLVTGLYDKGALSMEAAERLAYLGNAVIADKEES